MSKKSLSAKQEAFVQEYIVNGGNATQAAKKAGYKGSLKQLAVIGKQNLIKLNVSKAIESHREKVKTRFSLSFEDKQKMLVKNYQLAQSLGQISAANQAIAELNKMDGDHAPTRQRLESTDGNPLTLFIQHLSGNTIEPSYK